MQDIASVLGRLTQVVPGIVNSMGCASKDHATIVTLQAFFAQHDIELTSDPTSQKALVFRFEPQPQAGSRYTHPGVYCLRSNETTWDGERLWRTYTLLTDLEAVFRSLKLELGLRPLLHHNENWIDGHLFITVLAYQFVQIIRRTRKEKGSFGSWNSPREVLSS